MELGRWFPDFNRFFLKEKQHFLSIKYIPTVNYPNWTEKTFFRIIEYYKQFLKDSSFIVTIEESNNTPEKQTIDSRINPDDYPIELSILTESEKQESQQIVQTNFTKYIRRIQITDYFYLNLERISTNKVSDHDKFEIKAYFVFDNYVDVERVQQLIFEILIQLENKLYTYTIEDVEDAYNDIIRLTGFFPPKASKVLPLVQDDFQHIDEEQLLYREQYLVTARFIGEKCFVYFNDTQVWLIFLDGRMCKVMSNRFPDPTATPAIMEAVVQKWPDAYDDNMRVIYYDTLVVNGELQVNKTYEERMQFIRNFLFEFENTYFFMQSVEAISELNAFGFYKTTNNIQNNSTVPNDGLIFIKRYSTDYHETKFSWINTDNISFTLRVKAKYNESKIIFYLETEDKVIITDDNTIINWEILKESLPTYNDIYQFVIDENGNWKCLGIDLDHTFADDYEKFLRKKMFYKYPLSENFIFGDGYDRANKIIQNQIEKSIGELLPQGGNILDFREDYTFLPNLDDSEKNDIKYKTYYINGIDTRKVRNNDVIINDINMNSIKFDLIIVYLLLNNQPINDTLNDNPIIQGIKRNNLSPNGKILILSWSGEALEQVLKPAFGGITLSGFMLGKTYLLSSDVLTQMPEITSTEISKASPMSFYTNLGNENFSEMLIYVPSREMSHHHVNYKIKNFLLFSNKNKTLVDKEKILLKSLLLQNV